MKDAISAAQAFCESMKAFLIVDIPSSMNSKSEMVGWLNNQRSLTIIRRSTTRAC